MELNNNVQTQNFGMALKIKSLEALQKKSMKELDALEQIGERLKDTKSYHLEIDEKGHERIVSKYANEYDSPFNVREPYPYDKHLQVDTVWGSDRGAGMHKGDKYTFSIDLLNREAAQTAYAELNNLRGTEKVAKLVELLEEQEVRKEAEAVAKRQAQQAVDAKARSLMEKYAETVDI